MTSIQPSQLQVDSPIIQMNWDAPDIARLPVGALLKNDLQYRLFRLHEISEDKPKAYRQAIANVFSGLNASQCACVYILSGRPEGVELYLGVASTQQDADIHEAGKIFKAGFEGNFLGGRFVDLKNDTPEIAGLLSGSMHFGQMTGVPSFNEDTQQADDEDFQGVERLVNSLLGETWQLIIVAEPGSDAEIRGTLDHIYQIASDVSEQIKHSVQRSENTSQQFTETNGTSDSRTRGRSDSDTRGTSKGTSESRSTSAQSGQTVGTSDSKSSGTSHNDSRSTNKGTSESKGTSTSSNSSSSSSGNSTNKSINTGASESRSTGTNSSVTSGQTKSFSNNTSTSTSNSSNVGTNESRTTGNNHSTTQGTSNSSTRGHSSGSSVALTSERTDKRAEGFLKHLDETLTDRFLRGRAKGMYKTAVYLGAENRSTYERLARGVVSTFQGNQSSFTPLRVSRLPVKPYTLPELLQLRQLKRGTTPYQLAVAHSLPLLPDAQLHAATWLNSEELALIAGMPTRELPGLKIRKSVDFALNTNNPSHTANSVTLGHIVQHGRTLPHSLVRLSTEDLRKHIFVTGVTGAGKTTTCLKLLLESKLPFLVIEPAKTEYRALHGQGVAVEYYCLGREDLTPFRLNPFELLSPRQNLASHIDTLKATLAAVFPMEAAMPQIVEEAIIRAYQGKGWMIHEGENLLVDDPWAADSEVWPTFSDMIRELDVVIKSKGMGKEFEEKYRGSLVARLSSLTLGTKGRMLNTRRSMNFDQLLDKCVVIELEELKDEQDKALFMGLIITRLAECMKQRHSRDPKFQHLTLIEEAHRLLTRPEPGDGGARKMGVEMFANLLAEVRKYGEGLIIADQIPNKLVADVIKNTNTKIVHRLFAADDRNTIGDAMGLSDEQKDFLPMLQPGETVIYCGGWHAPVRLKVSERASTSGSVLNETEIQCCGQAQLWAQRHSLFPRLAQHLAMDNAVTLSAFLHDATLMLGMLLRLNPYSPTKSAPALRQRLRDRLLHKQQTWLNRLGMHELALADGLNWVLRDVAVQLPFNSEADFAQLAPALRQGLQKLKASLADFDAFANGFESNEVFSSLAEVNSI